MSHNGRLRETERLHRADAVAPRARLAARAGGARRLDALERAAGQRLADRLARDRLTDIAVLRRSLTADPRRHRGLRALVADLADWRCRCVGRRASRA